jgi:hypothetical protein
MQLSQQSKSMHVSINTASYDYAHIKAKLDLTYVHRQRLIRGMEPIEEIIDPYPAVFINVRVSSRTIASFTLASI